MSKLTPEEVVTAYLEEIGVDSPSLDATVILSQLCANGYHLVEEDLDDDTYGVPVDWVDDGLLWLVNKSVFHPRGFALAYNQEEEAWLLVGDGTESWRFEDSEDFMENEKFAAVEELFAEARDVNAEVPERPWPIAPEDYPSEADVLALGGRGAGDCPCGAGSVHPSSRAGRFGPDFDRWPKD